MYPIALVVLDGWGYRESKEGNAVVNCNPEHFNTLIENYPHTLLDASGESVGLPVGQMGNSEVGHLCLGAGRVILQELSRIDKIIETGKFKEIELLNKLFNEVKSNEHSIHLIGLLSDGGVHSHINHLKALIEMAKKKNVTRVYVHALLDGRDTPPKAALNYVKDLESFMQKLECGRIATIMGRYYAMDRDKRWERVEKAYHAMTQADGIKAKNAMEAVEAGYKRGETDEFLKPTIIEGGKHSNGIISDGDAVLFFNFRADRAREITQAFTEKEFNSFNRKKGLALSKYICFTMYDQKFDLPVVFPPEFPEKTFGEILSARNITQLRIAETEKYAHVTFFFNGGREKVFQFEDRALIPSPKVPTYDLKPEMSAYEVTGEVLKQIQEGKNNVIILNYANPDMVGHTGVYEAALKACKVVDDCLGKVIKEIVQRGGSAIVTADHGNSEEMIDEETGQPHTAHTTNLVPAILVSEKFKGMKLRESGILADVCPTLLEIMGIEQPPEMNGKSLLKN